MLKFYFSFTVCFFLLVACSSSESEIQLIAKGGPIYGGSVSYYASEKSEHIFPMSVVSMYDQRAVAPVYETLLSYDEDNQTLVSNLIEAYSFSVDNAYLDLKIRSVFIFTKTLAGDQNRRLVASDVKFTLDFACSRHELNEQGQLLTPKIIGRKIK